MSCCFKLKLVNSFMCLLLNLVFLLISKARIAPASKANSLANLVILPKLTISKNLVWKSTIFCCLGVLAVIEKALNSFASVPLYLLFLNGVCCIFSTKPKVRSPDFLPNTIPSFILPLRWPKALDAFIASAPLCLICIIKEFIAAFGPEFW